MSKIFKRPMFRKGGSTNEMNGIMSGIVDRENYQEAGRVDELKKQYLDLLMQNDEGDKSFDPLTTFLLQYGSALASAEPTGSLVGTAVGAAAKPIKTLIDEQDEQKKYLRGLRSDAVQLAIEQANKEDILKQQIEGQKDITRLELDAYDKKINEEVKNKLFENTYDQEKLNYPDNPIVAMNAAKYKLYDYERLANKVGSAKIYGALTFDINDPILKKQNDKQIKKNYKGKFVFDPYENKIKYISVDKNDKIHIESFDSIEEINLTDLESSTDTSDTSENNKKQDVFSRYKSYDKKPPISQEDYYKEKYGKNRNQ